MTGKEKPLDVLKREWITPAKGVFEHAECQKKIWELERSNASLQGKLDDVLSRLDCARGETVAATNRIKELKSQLASAQEKIKAIPVDMMDEIMDNDKSFMKWIEEDFVKPAERKGELAGLAKVVAEWTRVFYEDYERDYPEKLKEFGVWLERKKSELEGKGR